MLYAKQKQTKTDCLIVDVHRRRHIFMLSQSMLVILLILDRLLFL